MPSAVAGQQRRPDAAPLHVAFAPPRNGRTAPERPLPDGIPKRFLWLLDLALHVAALLLAIPLTPKQA